MPSLAVSQSMLPSENYLTSREASSEMPTSSDGDSHSQGVSLSPAMHTASENDSTCHSVPLPNQVTSEADLRTSGVSSVSSNVDRDLASQDASCVIPTVSEKHLSCGDTSLARYPATERDLPSQQAPITSPHISERISMPQASHWNETTAPTSQRTETIPLTTERMHTSTSRRNYSMAFTSQRTDTYVAPTSERVYMPIPHDNLGPLSHKSDGMATTSSNIDGTVHPAPDRLCMLETSHLNDNMDQPFERASMFKTSERIYVPATSHGSEHIGSASKRGEVALRSTLERLYMSAASQRNDNLFYTSQKSDHSLSTSKKMYTSIVHNNADVAEASERLYIPGAPQNRILKTE